METGGTWRAPDYWLNRDAVGESMKGNLTNSLESMGVAVKGFMLLKIDLPNTYEAAIVRTEVTKQEETTYMIERSIAATRQETQNIRVMGQAEIMKVNANASSVAT